MCLLHNIVTTVFFAGIVYWLIHYARRLRFYRQAWKFSGPPIVLPILGNALYFAGNAEHILNKFNELSRAYPSPYRVWLGSELLIILSRPEDIKTVLWSEKATEKTRFFEFFQPWLGNGLFTAPGEIWRVHRKLIGPTFNLRILESFVTVFAVQSNVMVKKMETELNGEEFLVFDYVSMCTLDIICETAMGVSVGAQLNNQCSYVEAVEKTLKIIYRRAFSIWLHPPAIFNRTQMGKEQNKHIETMHDFTNNIIQTKRKTLLNRNTKKTAVKWGEDTEGDLPLQRKACLDLLMELTDDKMKFSDSELREEVDTMIAAGNDTTSNTISFVMLMLASHPDVQEKAYLELCEIYGSCDSKERIVTHEDLPRMRYLELVIKETMRVLPIIALITRSISEDLDIGEYTLPKGSLAVIDILGIHRNKEFWPDPLKFNPDRFLPGEVVKRHACCYIPFSAGPRNCIGLRFAMMAMKTILATMLRRYIIKKDKIVPLVDVKLKSEGVIKPVEPIMLRIEERR
ncbi:cytochrome P450 4C1-like [Diprion similis]|uniref:cytochrome P450 4C1-like n=1 Tax=Diprion similis TaxID=362088 RepID=UPI001EF96969|nr:cytochrome P450 4C1-like [Diprion similis]